MEIKLIKYFALAFVGLFLFACSSKTPDSNEQETLARCSFEVSQDSLDTPTLLPAAPNWVIMGSSSAAGAGASPRSLSWFGLLTTEYAPQNVAVSNIAAGGYTTYQALSESCQVPDSRKQPDRNHNVDQALQQDADLVLVSFPSNDASIGYSARESLDNLLIMQKQLAAEKVAMMVVSSQPRNDIGESTIAELKKLDLLLASEFGACFVPVFDRLAKNDRLNPDYDHDGVHLNNAGHRVVFEAVRDRIKSYECVYW